MVARFDYFFPAVIGVCFSLTKKNLVANSSQIEFFKHNPKPTEHDFINKTIIV